MKNLYLNCTIHTVFFDIGSYICFMITTDCYHKRILSGDLFIFFFIEYILFFILLGFGKMLKWQKVYLSLLVVVFFLGKFFIYAFAEAISSV